MENTKGQKLDNDREQQRTNENQRSADTRQDISTERISTSLDEKSSTVGRNTKNTGISTKDGLTGSDYDGQVSDGR